MTRLTIGVLLFGAGLALVLLTGCATAGPDILLIHPESGIQRRCMTINTQVSRPNPWYGLAAIPAAGVGYGQALSEQERCVAESRREGFVERAW